MDTQSSGTLQSPSTYSESSKTTSSKSGGSVNKDKDRDFTKDNAASPIDLECQIQAERITKVLDEAIYKSKLALCLPNLVHEYKTLSSVLSTQHLDDLVFIFEQYANPIFSASLMNVGAMDEIRSGDVSLKNRLNPELGHLVHIINSYPALRPKVEEMVEEMKSNYATSTQDEEPQSSLEYILAMEQFREVLIKQMSTTAAEELAVIINTRKLEASNKKLIEKIHDYSTCLKDESRQFDETMTIKSEIIAKLEHELAMVTYDANIKLNKKILDSERQMVLATRSHAMRHEMLKEEEVDYKEAYENMLRLHLMEEKNQRTRRCKVEAQLLSWLQKYDTEMGDKQIELNDYAENYESQVQQCDELEARLAEQDKEFIPLMAEREEEYQQEMKEKLDKFILEHAVKVIQHSWRTVLANRIEKKKLQQMLKKKQNAIAAVKAAEAAAAAAAALAEKKAATAAKKQAAADKKAAEG